MIFHKGVTHLIDIHCHILPGIDDGAKTLDESVQMAQEAVSQGIHTIIATPHFSYRYHNERTAIQEKAAYLNEQLTQRNIPLTILPGQEIRIYGEILEDYESGKLLPLAEKNYAMIELPSGHVPAFTERILYDVQMKGLIPVIVHPERNQEIVQQPDKLYHLVKNGALTQITASSLCGDFGKNIKKFTLQLIEAELTHFIASDAHNVTTRSCKMAEAIEIIDKKYGSGSTSYYTENAQMLVNGNAIHREIPNRIKKRKLWGIFS